MNFNLQYKHKQNICISTTTPLNIEGILDCSNPPKEIKLPQT